jgi:hypothetical protein
VRKKNPALASGAFDLDRSSDDYMERLALAAVSSAAVTSTAAVSTAGMSATRVSAAVRTAGASMPRRPMRRGSTRLTAAAVEATGARSA